MQDQGYHGSRGGAKACREQYGMRQNMDENVVWVAKRIWVDGELRTVALRQSLDETFEASKRADIPPME